MLINGAQTESENSQQTMDEIATVLSTCKGATIPDQRMIDVAVITLQQLHHNDTQPHKAKKEAK